MRPDLAIHARLAQPWAVSAASLEMLRARLTRALSATDMAPQVAAKPKAKASNRRGKAAVIPVHGVLVHRTDDWSDLFGEVGYEDLARAVSSAVADDMCDGIVLDFASPGGAAYGASECAAAIATASKAKKCIAVVDPLCASGAYWLASQCSDVVITPSGECGSIGVYQLHVDQSKYLEEMGVKVTPVSVGKYKTATNPYEPLTDDGRAQIEKGIGAIYERFVKDVAKGRGVTQSRIREGFGQGGMASAEEAVKEGMADRVGTLDDVLARYGGATLVDTASAQSLDIGMEIRKRILQLG